MKSGKDIYYITSISSESMLMVKLVLDSTADFLTAAISLFWASSSSIFSSSKAFSCFSLNSVFNCCSSYSLFCCSSSNAYERTDSRDQEIVDWQFLSTYEINLCRHIARAIHDRLVLLVIGWKSGASFLSQSCCVIMQNQNIASYFQHPGENRSMNLTGCED